MVIYTWGKKESAPATGYPIAGVEWGGEVVDKKAGLINPRGKGGV